LLSEITGEGPVREGWQCRFVVGSAFTSAVA
jgi:hypothetical protein